MGHQQTKFTKPPQLNKSAMSKYAKPAHKRAARLLGYALTLGNGATWWMFAALISIILTSKERAALAFMALNALDYDEAVMVADEALNSRARSEES